MRFFKFFLFVEFQLLTIRVHCKVGVVIVVLESQCYERVRTKHLERGLPRSYRSYPTNKTSQGQCECRLTLPCNLPRLTMLGRYTAGLISGFSFRAPCLSGLAS